MTSKEMISLNKAPISFLYSKEGRSISYISRLFNVSRKVLSDIIKSWNLPEPESNRYLSPSNQKYVNANRQLIKRQLDDDISITDIAKRLSITRDKLKYLIARDNSLKTAYDAHANRIKNNAELRRQSLMNNSSYDYDFADKPNEIWKDIMGYPGYMISNYGRAKHYSKRYKAYHLIHSYSNRNNSRLYVTLESSNKNKNVQVSNLVGHAFVSGYDTEHNTINHKDGNVQNNWSENLEWLSQSDNNKHSYRELHRPIVNKKKYRFSKLIYKDKYEFKTIAALSRFMNVSPTQIRRYLDNPSKHNIKLIA